MDIDIGQLRFFTKVAEKAPRGLRLLLFKPKGTNQEKLVFIVKTASEDLEKLALSKMTWIIEKIPANPRIIAVRFLVLPDGAKDFFKSEAGLIITEDKDIKSLEALANQRGVEIYFFSEEPEFHSKIELPTTPRMLSTAKKFFEEAVSIRNARSLNKSETLSDLDMKNAIKTKEHPSIKKEELRTSIKDKENTVNLSNIIETKKEPEILKNDKLTITAEELAKTIPPEIMKSGSSGLTMEDLKNAVSLPPNKLTAEELAKTIPPKSSKNDSNSSLTMEDLFKSVPANSHKSESIINKLNLNQTSKEPEKTSPSNLAFDLSALDGLDFFGEIKTSEPVSQPESKENDFLSNTFSFNNQTKVQENVISTPSSSSFTQESAINNNLNDSKKINLDEINKTQDLLSMLKQEGGFSEISEINTLYSKITPSPDNLLSELKNEETPLPKNDIVPKSESFPSIKDKLSDTGKLNIHQNTFKVSQEEHKSLLSELMSEPTPLPKDNIVPKSESFANPIKLENKNSYNPSVNIPNKPRNLEQPSPKNLEENNESDPSENISVKDAPINLFSNNKPLLKPPPINKQPIVLPNINSSVPQPLKPNRTDIQFNLPINEPVINNKNDSSPDLNININDSKKIIDTEINKKQEILPSLNQDINSLYKQPNIIGDNLLSELKQEFTPLPDIQPIVKSESFTINKQTEFQAPLLSELMMESTPLKTSTGDTTNLAKAIEENIIVKPLTIEDIQNKKDISPDDLMRVLGDL
ncbi:MAG: hypothetical protein U0457_17425 [Candidatus Sericytochromatia bacterium]